jgi:copper chaperone CopZ
MAIYTFRVEGVTCQNCVNSIGAKLASQVDSLSISIDNKIAEVVGDDLTLVQLNQMLEGTRYRFVDVDSINAVADPVLSSWFETYRPLLLIVAFIFGSSLLVQLPLKGISVNETMRYFMAGFFLVFSFFKLLDLSAFASAYANYDLIAKRWRGWGFVYPFAELTLGACYLSNIGGQILHMVTFLLMSFSALGVIQSVLNKTKIRCACLGTVFQLPMSTITIVEDLGMALMALLMLL